MKKLSVIVPVYNEKSTILKMIGLIKASPHPLEIVIVDDCSTDGTREILKQIDDSQITVLFHSKNAGKGAAIRTAIGKISGDVTLIQDADLEYSPKDYPQLLAPILDDLADVVYGSRFLGGPHRVLFFWHYFGNWIFTTLTNILYDINLSDMGTCYKAFRTEILQSLQLKSDRFGIEPEITAKVCKKKAEDLRSPHFLSGPHLCGRKKNHLEGRFPLFLGAAALSVL